MAELYHGTFGASAGRKPEPPAPAPQKMADADLRSLIELGCVRDDIKIGEAVFTLRTLNISERLSAMNFLGENPDQQKMFEFNLLVLSLSLEAMNGVPVETLHPRHGEDLEPAMLKRDLISRMQPVVLNKLVDFYAQITERGEAQFSAEQLKNS